MVLAKSKVWIDHRHPKRGSSCAGILREFFLRDTRRAPNEKNYSTDSIEARPFPACRGMKRPARNQTLRTAGFFFAAAPALHFILWQALPAAVLYPLRRAHRVLACT